MGDIRKFDVLQHLPEQQAFRPTMVQRYISILSLPYRRLVLGCHRNIQSPLVHRLPHLNIFGQRLKV